MIRGRAGDGVESGDFSILITLLELLILFGCNKFFTIEDTEKCESTKKLNRNMPFSLCALCLCVFVVKLSFKRIRYTTAARQATPLLVLYYNPAG